MLISYGFSSGLIRLLPIVTATSVFAQLQPIPISFPEQASSEAALNVVLDNFLGISWELSSFNTLWGDTPSALPPAMQNYLVNIRDRLSNPLRIRVGGNAMDDSTYDPDYTDKMLEITDTNAYFNNIPVRFGPVLWDVMNAMAASVGDMQFVITLSMTDPDNYANDAQVAQAAMQKLGDSLDAMLLGNEPDLYNKHGVIDDYELTDYIPEVGSVIQLFQNDSLLTNTSRLLGGPTVCCNWDLIDVLQAGLTSYPEYKYFTVQHYPANICSGADASNTNMTYFLTHSNVQNYVWWNDGNWRGINYAKSLNVPVILTEFNSVACGGSNISDTFAMALWSVDVALQAARANISGVYIHTREFNVTYNLFDPPAEGASMDAGWHTRPNYYSTLVLAETLSSTGSVVTELDVGNQLKTAAYSIHDNSGTTRSKLALFNYMSSNIDSTEEDSSDSDLTRIFEIPANITEDQIAIRYLLAPTVDFRTPWDSSDSGSQTGNVTWANQTVGSLGEMTGTQATTYLSCKDGCNVSVPAPGLAIVFILSNNTDSLYDGNDTEVATASVTYSGASSLTGNWGSSRTLLLGLGFVLLLLSSN
ncbi:hypothetical protein C8Q75DRAFT_812250 [Abortiporus biennis]|nr:hypothetical protein C8Q75DRAFT_812250 [Abortiporus biennis]